MRIIFLLFCLPVFCFAQHKDNQKDPLSDSVCFSIRDGLFLLSAWDKLSDDPSILDQKDYYRHDFIELLGVHMEERRLKNLEQQKEIELLKNSLSYYRTALYIMRD